MTSARGVQGPPQPIVAFDRDEEGHWRAVLACGHRRHVRHDPPWQVREWTQTAEGRQRFLGVMLECRKCLEEDPGRGDGDLRSTAASNAKPKQ